MATTYAAVQQLIRAASPLPFVGGTNLLHADRSSKMIPCRCDFAATGIPALGYTIDATPYFQQGSISSVQTLYLDNSLNNGYLTVQNPLFAQSFSLPPGYQGYFPCLVGKGSGGLFYVTSPGAGTGIAVVALLNVFLPAMMWPALATPITPGLTQPVSDAILDATVSGGRVLTRSLPSQFTATDHSGTIAVGGAAQIAAAADAARVGFLIQNLDITEGLWISLTAGAVIGGAGSFELAPGADSNFPGGVFQGVVSNDISVNATTAAHKYSCMTW